ncbi:Protein FMC1 [Nymphon striatum]|nr:Protein FMC1 [Nymphon striatum]
MHNKFVSCVLENLLIMESFLFFKGNVKDKLAYSYITQQYKNNIVTDQKLCRGSKELHHMASSYLCYLKSNRKYQSLFNEYHSKSNRSIAETAGIVGLRVPKTYDA